MNVSSAKAELSSILRRRNSGKKISTGFPVIGSGRRARKTGKTRGISLSSIARGLG